LPTAIRRRRLCAALRILKQLRDIEHTNDRPARLSIPEEYVRNAFISPTHLRALAAKGQTQAVIDRVLDGVDRLVGEARELPRLIRNRRLKIYVSIVLCRAGKLAARLRRADPLHETVGLTRWQRLTCMWINIAAGLLRP
jgi:phytoene/squalene synthetase